MHNSAASPAPPPPDCKIYTSNIRRMHSESPLRTVMIDKGQKTARRRRFAATYRNMLLDSLAVGGGRKYLNENAMFHCIITFQQWQ